MNDYNARHLARLSGLLDVRALSGLRIAIVGLGRVGMAVLFHLIRLPINQIFCVDHDEVSPRELGSLFPVNESERFKVRAAQRLVQFWNPHLKFQPVLMKVAPETLPRFGKLVGQVDVLVWAADDWPMLQLVCDRFHDQIPMIGCAMAENARYAEIGWSVPDQTPPLPVTLQASAKRSEAGASSVPVFVDAAANVAVSVALGLVLKGRKGDQLFGELLDRHHPLIIVHSAHNQFSQSSNLSVPRLVRLMRVRSS